jgi:hypothetical protein
MKNATSCERPWEDPILFANHFRRKWQEFFNVYILKKWASKIGGITDFCWVMEIQDRGNQKEITLFIAVLKEQFLNCMIPSYTLCAVDEENCGRVN